MVFVGLVSPDEPNIIFSPLFVENIKLNRSPALILCSSKGPWGIESYVKLLSFEIWNISFVFILAQEDKRKTNKPKIPTDFNLLFKAIFSSL